MDPLSFCDFIEEQHLFIEIRERLSRLALNFIDSNKYPFDMSELSLMGPRCQAVAISFISWMHARARTSEERIAGKPVYSAMALQNLKKIRNDIPKRVKRSTRTQKK